MPDGLRVLIANEITAIHNKLTALVRAKVKWKNRQISFERCTLNGECIFEEEKKMKQKSTPSNMF